MSELVQHLDELTSASRAEDLWLLHTAKMKTYGFDRLIYGFTRYGGTRSLGNPDDWLILSTQTPEYMKYFINDGLYYDAPMLRWALENKGACSWRWISEQERAGNLSAPERKVMAFNNSQSVTAGYTISFRTISPRIKGAIALTARSGLSQDDVDAIWETHGREIHMLNKVMHLKVQTLPYEGDRRLTKRQREVLQWVGDGKSIQDIALLMDRTPATVEKHLRLAREALGVTTTAQAVLKAGWANQMFLVEPEG